MPVVHPPPLRNSHGWIDGTAIVIAILLVAFVTATNNYRKELQFRSLRNDANAMVRVRCIRSGEEVQVPVADVVVGDVVHLETGDKVRTACAGVGVPVCSASVEGEAVLAPFHRCRPAAATTFPLHAALLPHTDTTREGLPCQCLPSCSDGHVFPLAPDSLPP